MNEVQKGTGKYFCPFWNQKESIECTMIKGGMYIPLPEHVQMFCMSSRYVQCRQYIHGIEMTRTQENHVMNNEFLDSKDRRRMKRYPELLYFDLAACDKNKGPQVINIYKAKSLDISLGGMRLESHNEFMTDTLISFVMDPDFSSEDLLGVGEVKWCRPKENSTKYEMGIAFSNYSTAKNIKEFLRI